MLARATIGRILAFTVLTGVLLVAVSQQRRIMSSGQALLSFNSSSDQAICSSDADCGPPGACVDGYQTFYFCDSDGTLTGTEGCHEFIGTCEEENCGGDTDGDGTCDDNDNCPELSNADQADLDGDGAGNVCDDDTDGDGCMKEGVTASNACGETVTVGADPNDLVPGAQTQDDDGLASGQNGCDRCPNSFEGAVITSCLGGGCISGGPEGAFMDSDGDGVPDGCDKCAHVANPNQEDLDNDGLGDQCDDDIDGDGCGNTYIADNGSLFIDNQCTQQTSEAGSDDDPKPLNPAISCNDGCRQKTQFGCGNCQVDEGEQCDDGELNTDNPEDLAQPSCRLDCTLPLCSNGQPDEDDVPDTWADNDDPACHEGGCADCNWQDTEYLPSKNDENNECMLPSDGPPVEDPPEENVGFIRRVFAFLLGAHNADAPLWNGHACGGQDAACASQDDRDYRCAPKFQQGGEWVYECKRLGEEGDPCNYGTDCEDPMICLQEIGGQYGHCTTPGNRPQCDADATGGGGGGVPTGGSTGGITSGGGGNNSQAPGECLVDADCGADVYGECKLGCTDGNKFIPPGSHCFNPICIQHLHAPNCDRGAAAGPVDGMCIKAQDWYVTCAMSECDDDPNNTGGATAGTTGTTGGTTGQTTSVGITGGTTGGTGGSSQPGPGSSARSTSRSSARSSSRGPVACEIDAQCGSVIDCDPCAPTTNGCERKCIFPDCLDGQCGTQEEYRACNPLFCGASSSRSSQRISSSSRSSRRSSISSRRSSSRSSSRSSASSASSRRSVGGQCTGNECANGGDAVCGGQGRVCIPSTNSTCFTCAPGTGGSSARGGNSSRSIAPGQCGGDECSIGGDEFCTSQGKVCEATSTFPCLRCVTDTGGSSAGGNGSASRSNQCQGNECSIGGDAVCGGLGKVCVHTANNPCMQCVPGSASSRSASNRSAASTSNRCGGDECANGGDAVCGGLGKVCVIDSTVSSCIRCAVGSTSSSRGSNRSVSLSSRSQSRGSQRSVGLQCRGDECALGGNVVCAGLGKVCATDPAASSCFTCIPGNASSRTGSNRSASSLRGSNRSSSSLAGSIRSVSSLTGSNRSTSSARLSASSRGCVNDNQCPSGQSCVDGICKECTDNAHCPSNRCVDGLCEQCTDDSQCPANQQCINGSCGCTDDSRCPANQQCLNGQCTGCTDNAQCASNLCMNGQCVECFNNNQCPSGICQSGFCVPPVCGNGVIERGEFCDDGNQTDGDACGNDCNRGVNQGCTDNAQCASNLCENGRCRDCTSDVQCGAGRLCVSGECLSTEQIASQPNFCGNRRIDPGEACDLGDQNSLAPNAFCRPDCTLGRCGDGILDTPLELCDDGNDAPQDGCDALCRPERLAPSQLPANIINLPFVPRDNTTGATDIGGGSSTVAPQTPVPGTTPGTGPATIAIMSAGAAAGYAYMRRRRRS